MRNPGFDPTYVTQPSLGYFALGRGMVVKLWTLTAYQRVEHSGMKECGSIKTIPNIVITIPVDADPRMHNLPLHGLQ